MTAKEAITTYVTSNTDAVKLAAIMVLAYKTLKSQISSGDITYDATTYGLSKTYKFTDTAYVTLSNDLKFALGISKSDLEAFYDDCLDTVEEALKGQSLTLSDYNSQSSITTALANASCADLNSAENLLTILLVYSAGNSSIQDLVDEVFSSIVSCLTTNATAYYNILLGQMKVSTKESSLFGLSSTSLLIIGAAAVYWFKFRKS